MIFVDASALIAIITGEEDADSLANTLESDPYRVSSALAVWETVAGLCRSYTFSVPGAHIHVARFLAICAIRIIGIAERELDLATDAYAQYGKGRHPAALNMRDCFAYACAKANGARLLSKGEDFSKTDLAW